MRSSVVRLCTQLEPESKLSKSIWKASVRSVRVDSVWENFSKQVVAQAPFLTPRDVATVVHSFARVKFRDVKTLAAMTPSILKHLDAFSVREIVHIMSAFRKLEYAKLDCIDLLINQLVLNFPEWNEVDCALIANAVGWFRVFDDSIWRQIYKFSLKHDFEPLGLSLIVGAMAKLDKRYEPVLRRFSRQLINPQTQGVFKQESFAIIVHAFYKLGWTRDLRLNEFFQHELKHLLQEENFFDFQSLGLVMHALFCYRVKDFEKGFTELETEILGSGVRKILTVATEHKISIDQYRRLVALVKVAAAHSLPDDIKEDLDVLKRLMKKQEFNSRSKRGHKLPRWEYEVYRILKDKMQIPVTKRVRDGRTDIFVKPVGGGEDVCVMCLGPFQYYTDSTKRTTASVLNQHLVGKKTMEIPFYIWNELKTDQDKILFLYSQGRRVAAAIDSEITSEIDETEWNETGEDEDTISRNNITETEKSQLLEALENS